MTKLITSSFLRSFSRGVTRVFMLVLGIFFFVPMAVYYLIKRKENAFDAKRRQVYERLEQSGEKAEIEAEVRQHVGRKLAFFGKDNPQEREKETKRVLTQRLEERARQILREEHPGLKAVSYPAFVAEKLQNGAVMAWLATLGFPAFVFILLMANGYLKYVFERLILMVFVVFGVTFLVFTMIHISPQDPSYNILGDVATQAQRDDFNRAYGLDQPYIKQLWNSFKGIATLNPGKSYVGGEDVISAISGRFPVTLQMTFFSLALAVLIAVPAGILSALKPYSIADYVVMLIALIGLSLPAFWFGQMLVLTFSVRYSLLPPMYNTTWLSLLMPAIVMGTGLMASVARMTRSSMMEVMSQDYITTAKAKGISQRKVIVRHALGNAMIPIVTIVGIQFGSMLGGATIAEKVFNIPGIGSWLVDKQFIPDMPAVLAGVVYISIVAGLVNLVVDILYAFLDPRIKAKIKGS